MPMYGAQSMQLPRSRQTKPQNAVVHQQCCAHLGPTNGLGLCWGGLQLPSCLHARTMLRVRYGRTALIGRLRPLLRGVCYKLIGTVSGSAGCCWLSSRDGSRGFGNPTEGFFNLSRCQPLALQERPLGVSSRTSNLSIQFEYLPLGSTVV